MPSFPEFCPTIGNGETKGNEAGNEQETKRHFFCKIANEQETKGMVFGIVRFHLQSAPAHANAK